MPKLNCKCFSCKQLCTLLTNSDTTRKATGVRLGQLVQKDLKKKEKSTTANRDPHLELNIAGKELGEEGLQVVCGTTSN